MASRQQKDHEELEGRYTELSEELERVQLEYQHLMEAMAQSKKETDQYKSKAVAHESRCKIAEEAMEKQYEEAQRNKAMVREAMEKLKQYKSESERREKEISGLQTDLSTSVKATQSLQDELGELKSAFAKAAGQMKDRDDDKVDTTRMLIQKIRKLRHLDRHLEDDLPTPTAADEQGEQTPGTKFDRVPPEWQEAEEERSSPVEEYSEPSTPDPPGGSLDDELARRRGLDGDSPGSSSNGSDTSRAPSLFDLDKALDESPPLTDVSDNETDLPPREPATLAGNDLDNAVDLAPPSESSPPGHQKLEHPEFRLDLLEQSGPRKRIRIREYQDQTVVQETNPWKASQKSRLPMALVKDLSRLTLQDASGKKPIKPSAKQVKSILKQLPGNSQAERFKHLRPDRFKRSKREKPPASDPSAAVQYTVMVDPAMAQNTNMFGNQVPASQPALQSTQTSHINSTGIHGNMFAPEVLAPPVARTAAPTNANNAVVDNTNGPLHHYGPSANRSKPQPVAQPLRRYKPLGPSKDRPTLPRIVRNNYPGAVYRPTPYGEGSSRLNIPWAAWMTKMRAENRPASGTTGAAPAQASWNFDDFFQPGAGSTDLLPEHRRFWRKWRIAFTFMTLLLIFWYLSRSDGPIHSRDMWMEVNDVPRTVHMHMRGPMTVRYRWMDILEYELLRWSGINRVAMG